MHGIVHKTLKTYVVAKTDDETWGTILDRADVEPRLYLPVGHYDNAEVDAVLDTLASMAVQDRPAIERDFGRALAPELCATFGAHLDSEATLPALLTDLESIAAAVGRTNEQTAPPAVSGVREDDRTVVVSYASERGYCDLAHGLLEGLADECDADATVTKRGCVRDDADDCTFDVAFE